MPGLGSLKKMDNFMGFFNKYDKNTKNEQYLNEQLDFIL